MLRSLRATVVLPVFVNASPTNTLHGVFAPYVKLVWIHIVGQYEDVALACKGTFSTRFNPARLEKEAHSSMIGNVVGKVSRVARHE
jgi:hypothetical protein